MEKKREERRNNIVIKGNKIREIELEENKAT